MPRGEQKIGPWSRFCTTSCTESIVSALLVRCVRDGCGTDVKLARTGDRRRWRFACTGAGGHTNAGRRTHTKRRDGTWTHSMTLPRMLVPSAMDAIASRPACHSRLSWLASIACQPATRSIEWCTSHRHRLGLPRSLPRAMSLLRAPDPGVVSLNIDGHPRNRRRVSVRRMHPEGWPILEPPSDASVDSNRLNVAVKYTYCMF